MIRKSKTVSVSISMFMAVLAIALLSNSVLAVGIQDDALQGRRIMTLARPDPEGTPTKVTVAIYVIDMMAVDDLRQTFTADFFAMINWRDERLALSPADTQAAPRTFKMDEIWNPQLTIVNQRNLDKAFPDVLRADAEGNVNYVQRFQGELTTNLALQDFPFDSQSLTIKVASLRYSPEELEFSLDESRTGSRSNFSIPGWTVGKGTAKVTTEYIEVQDRHLARIDLTAEVKRHTGYYTIKALLPLLLIMFMAWAVFFIPPASLGPQIGIPTSSIFALFLFMHRISQLLPRISYLTRMDRFILGAITLVFITLGEAIWTSIMAIKDKEEQARKIDRWARFIYLILLVFVIVYSFIL